MRVLVLGGYGVFGRRAAERLARVAGLELIVAGRNGAAAEALVQSLGQAGAAAALEVGRIDAATLDAARLREMRVGAVLNTVGPFQAQDYRVARAAIAARAHYVDIADARAFVTGIVALDADARAAGVLVVSGASSVPALAAAVIDVAAETTGPPTDVTCGISPGNSFDPGEATVASILSGIGWPFLSLADGRMQPVHGWQPLAHHRFREPAVGTRLLGACDVPDLDLFPARYPTLRTQRFIAGVEVKAFHLGLWALSWLARAGLAKEPGRIAAPLMALKRRLSFLGSDRGAMFVTVGATATGGPRRERTWELIANRGHGPYIPTVPAVILVKRLAAGQLAERGARPCLGLMTLADFTREVADLDIRQSWA